MSFHIVKTWAAQGVRLSALLLVAAAGLAAAATTDELNVQSYPGTTLSLPLYAGQAKGIFEKHGIKVNIVGIPAGPQATQALLTGGVDIMGNGVSNTLLAQAKLAKSGSSERIVGLLQGESGLHYSLMGQSGIKWPAQGDVKAVAEALKGKTVGVTAIGADTQQIVEGLLKMHGVDPKSVTFVAIGSGASAYAAFEAKHVDTVVGWAPTQTVLSDKGAKMLIDFRKGEGGSFSPWTILTYQALKSNVDKSPQKFVKFQKAIEEATAFTKDPKNLDELVAIFSKSGASGLTPDQLRRAIAEYQPLYETTFDCRILPTELVFYTKYAGSLSESDAATCDQYMWSGAKAYMKNNGDQAKAK
jgi:NitT/TauT family transport system substrate-binding protein